MMKTLLSVFKKYFIPQKENHYKPHFLREGSVVAISFIAIVAFFVVAFQQAIITRTNLLAEIFPKVLVDLANTDRVKNNLHTLTINPLLVEAAKQKANDMATKSYFAHTSPEGVTPWHWFQMVGYDFTYAGENLAVDFSDSIDVDQAWMESAGHRANILNKQFSEIGIGTAQGTFEGRVTTFVVQMFGRPLLRKTTIPPQATFLTRVVETQVAEAPTEKDSTRIKPPKETSSSRVLSVGTGSEMFIAVATTNAQGEPPDVTTTVSQESRTPLASLAENVASNPKRNLFFFYGVLVSLVGIALVLMIFIQIRIQHPRNILYGVGVITLIALLFFVYQNFITLPVGIL